MLVGEAARVEVPRMYYSNFDENITAKYGVKIVGWPLDKFCPPSDITSKVEVLLLFRAWESGTARFYKMTTQENWRIGIKRGSMNKCKRQ